MQQIDSTAIDTVGIPRLLLMEHAGLAVARAAHMVAPHPAAAMVVCCGTGFNGGDGLAAARHLQAWGHPVRIVLAGCADRLRDESATFAAILRRLEVPIRECGDGAKPGAGFTGEVSRELAQGAVVIDALLGIGVRGAVREPVRSLIATMNQTATPRVCADIPSGLDADTGRVQGIAVRATVTVSFGLAKRGCFLEDGPAYVGRLLVDSISIPPHLLTVS